MPSARIRPATASQAAPIVSARTVCGPSPARRIVTTACYGAPPDPRMSLSTAARLGQPRGLPGPAPARWRHAIIDLHVQCGQGSPEPADSGVVDTPAGAGTLTRPGQAVRGCVGPSATFLFG